MTKATTATLSKTAQDYIDAQVKKYPEDQRQSAVLAALTFVQNENGGWLTESLMNAVADCLQMPRIAVYEVASFYSLYDTQPTGRHKISVCTNVSCMLRGAEKVGEHLKKTLGVDYKETTQDGRVTLKEVECLGACVHAPVVQIDDKYHENMTPEKLDKLVSELE